MKIVKFAQTVCGPCNILNMMMADMGVQADETYLLDTEEEFNAAEEQHGVMSTPTLILFDEDDNEIDRTVGVRPPAIQGLFAKAGKL